MPLDNQTVLAFNAISGFCEFLAEEFKKMDLHLALYCRLIERTTLRNTGPIKKHLQAFSKFFRSNKEEVIGMEAKNFKPAKIKYSDKVYIPIKKVFMECNDDEVKMVMWKHVLTIFAILDPRSGAKKVLRRLNGEEEIETPNFGDSNEGQFLGKMMEDLQDQVDPNEKNPMAAVMKLMQSGYINKLAQDIGQGMESGNFDMGKMFGQIHKISGETKTDSEDEKKNMEQVQNMTSNIMQMMKNQEGGNEEDANVNVEISNEESSTPSVQPSSDPQQPPFDMSGMMNMMGSLMGSLGGMGNMPGMPNSPAAPAPGGAPGTPQPPNIMSMMGSLMGQNNPQQNFLKEERLRIEAEKREKGDDKKE